MAKYTIPIPTSTFTNAKGTVEFRDANVSVEYAGKRVNITLTGDIKDITAVRSKINMLQKMVSPWNIPIPALGYLKEALVKYTEKRKPLVAIKWYLETLRDKGIINDDKYLDALKNLGGEK